MRKLILIATMALMSTSSCYANLSLASSDNPPTAIEQPKPRPAEVRPVAVGRSAETARHRRTHIWAEARSFYQSRRPCW